MQILKQNNHPYFELTEVKNEGRERIPHTWASSDENYLKSIFGSVSYCVVILRKTPRWPVRMTSCNFKLLTWEQQIKKPSQRVCELIINFK